MTTLLPSRLDLGIDDPYLMDAGAATDGWYTPATLIGLAHLLLGAIDLDPASCQAAQAVVKAKRYHTKADDGLMQPWTGRVWLNPPYSAPTVWVRKVLTHYQSGDISQALVLTNSYTETNWWQDLAAVGMVLFFRGRQEFWHPEKVGGRNRTGQTLVYLGKEQALFRSIFGHLGVVR